jgi:crotonobetainyl-CoA:carnitine CoA-transferase CaiB-like acyl-CoA transferase
LPRANRDGFGQPLKGLRVLDLAADLAGRFCARLLSDAGADVLRLGRDDDPSEVASTSEYVLAYYVDRGKSVAPSTDADVASLLPMTDAIIHDSGVGRNPWSLDFRQLLGLCPRLVIVSITPFGETGPRAGWLGDDLIAVASGGLAHTTPGMPDFSRVLDQESPLHPDALIGELMGGLHGAIGAMLAILARQRSGHGEYVEISMQEVVAAIMPWDIMLWTYGGNIVGRRQVRTNLAPNSYLPAAEDWMVLVAFAENHWHALVEMMGSPDWADNELFATAVARGENWEALEPLLTNWLQTQSRWEFLEGAQTRGIPSAPALELPDALENEHSSSRSFLVRTQIEGVGETLLPGDVFVVNGQRREIRSSRRVVLLADVRQHWSRVEESPSAQRPDSSLPSLPLQGVRIADFGQYFAVPLAGQWLALMGAEVILVESRMHLHSRRHAPFAGEPHLETSGLFNDLNLGKNSVTINLRVPEGVELARRLIGVSDVVIENFSPDTMEKLGIGYEELRRIKPDIIMVSLSAFGSTGPWRQFASFHSGVIALSGLAAVTGYEGGHPRLVGSSVPDPIGSSFCVLAVLQALQNRNKTGQGQHIEIAMAETLQSLMPEAIAEYGLTGGAPERHGNRHRWKTPHAIYRCHGDDAWVAISVGDGEQWRGLCSALGRAELSEAAAFASQEDRKRNEQALDLIIAEWAKHLSAEKAAARLQREGVPASAVFNARDLIEDPHLRARNAIVDVMHPKAGSHPIVAVPWRFSLLPAIEYRRAPLLGESNEFVFQNLLGLTAAQVEELERKQVIY